MPEVIKKGKKNMKFKAISFFRYALCVGLLTSHMLFTFWLPPLFFEDQQKRVQQNQKEEPMVIADAGIGKTHFVVGANTRVLPSAPPAYTAQSSKEVPLFDGIALNCDGHVCSVLFDKFYDTLAILMEKEQKSILVAAYMLTDKRIASWLCDAHARGVRVEVISDMSCLRERSNKLGNLYESSIPVFICMPEHKGARSSLMHNKFILFGSNIYGRKIVWTGSANLTRAAFDEVHHENVLILDDSTVYQEYEKKFAKLKKQSERYEHCTITNAALHDKIRTSNNMLDKGVSDKR